MSAGCNTTCGPGRVCLQPRPKRCSVHDWATFSVRACLSAPRGCAGTCAALRLDSCSARDSSAWAGCSRDRQCATRRIAVFCSAHDACSAPQARRRLLSRMFSTSLDPAAHMVRAGIPDRQASAAHQPEIWKQRVFATSLHNTFPGSPDLPRRQSPPGVLPPLRVLLSAPILRFALFAPSRLCFRQHVGPPLALAPHQHFLASRGSMLTPEFTSRYGDGGCPITALQCSRAPWI